MRSLRKTRDLIVQALFAEEVRRDGGEQAGLANAGPNTQFRFNQLADTVVAALPDLKREESKCFLRHRANECGSCGAVNDTSKLIGCRAILSIDDAEDEV